MYISYILFHICINGPEKTYIHITFKFEFLLCCKNLSLQENKSNLELITKVLFWSYGKYEKPIFQLTKKHSTKEFFFL